jgi:hypothetical protein
MNGNCLLENKVQNCSVYLTLMMIMGIAKKVLQTLVAIC